MYKNSNGLSIHSVLMTSVVCFFAIIVAAILFLPDSHANEDKTKAHKLGVCTNKYQTNCIKTSASVI